MDMVEKWHAPRVLARLREREREHAEHVEWCRRHGWGPKYCIHGTPMWTDYDSICPGCEDSLSLYEEALNIIRYEVAEFRRRMEVMGKVGDVMRESRYVHDQVWQDVLDVLARWADQAWRHDS